MKLSAPIPRLKSQARSLSRSEGIPLHEALDRVARREGFNAWSLLVNRAFSSQHSKTLLAELKSGDLALIGARPYQGKTRLCLELIVAAMKAGRRGVFFSLEYNPSDIADSFVAIGESMETYQDRFEFDDSDDICAPYIVERLATAPADTLVVIDYLQLLDQKRTNPSLAEQVVALKACAKERRLIIVCISQINRSFDETAQPVPGLADVRLPNPLDTTLFNKAYFLNNGEMRAELSA
jgi:replicative DNA helicase